MKKQKDIKRPSVKWGFLRETREMAIKAGLDADTGLHRTGMEDYLKVIFPEIPEDAWIHDKPFLETGRKIRPDYRCDELKLIIEFDGTQHYQQPDTISKDVENQAKYEELGYKVVRIPYFVQLTNEVVKTMFGKDVKEPLFDPTIPSMGVKGRNTPAYCCPAGLERMAKEFHRYPDQYKVNVEALKQEDDFLTGCSMLEQAYENYAKTNQLNNTIMAVCTGKGRSPQKQKNLVKVFYENSEEVQNEVNKWLKANENDCEIVDIKLSSCQFRDCQTKTIVLIHYKPL